MLTWVLGRLKWLGLIAAVGPLVATWFEYESVDMANNYMKNGIEAEATIDGGTRTKRRRSGTSFSLDLSWQDKQGRTQRAEKVAIPRDIADRIIADDKLTVDKIKIRYIPDDPSKPPSIAAHSARTAGDPTGAALKMLGMLAPVSLIGAALFFFLHRRERRA